MKKGIISVAVILMLVFVFLFIQEQRRDAQSSIETSSTMTNEVASNQTNNNAMQETLSAQPALDPSLENITRATLKTSQGDIVVEFYKDDSPNTVNNFIALADSGYYDGIKFHRVIDNFMIQSGDPLSKDDSQKSLWGTGGPDYTFADEFNDHKIVKGSLAMANRGPNTNGSQFFIVTAAATPWLDGMHTNFGYVVDGMEVVEAIGTTATDGADRPLEDVVINSIELE